ncbi:hypothetical protein [Deinococcus ficus]|uniref:hypothetical protein n=1 Tax=Deinococcus ficus TaxID=317577 RepID=UPI0012DC2D9E|nr:hypothetical protein [Deinococcus ficus]
MTSSLFREAPAGTAAHAVELLRAMPRMNFQNPSSIEEVQQWNAARKAHIASVPASDMHLHLLALTPQQDVLGINLSGLSMGMGGFVSGVLVGFVVLHHFGFALLAGLLLGLVLGALFHTMYKAQRSRAVNLLEAMAAGDRSGGEVQTE